MAHAKATICVISRVSCHCCNEVCLQSDAWFRHFLGIITRQRSWLAVLASSISDGWHFISLPLQGQLWLGHRANQPLPPSLLSWYFEIAEKMRKEGCPVTRPQTKPRYMELAVLLKKAFENMDNAFTQRWF